MAGRIPNRRAGREAATASEAAGAVLATGATENGSRCGGQGMPASGWTGKDRGRTSRARFSGAFRVQGGTPLSGSSSRGTAKEKACLYGYVSTIGNRLVRPCAASRSCWNEVVSRESYGSAVITRNRANCGDAQRCVSKGPSAKARCRPRMVRTGEDVHPPVSGVV